MDFGLYLLKLSKLEWEKDSPLINKISSLILSTVIACLPQLLGEDQPRKVQMQQGRREQKNIIILDMYCFLISFICDIDGMKIFSVLFIMAENQFMD